MKVAVISVLLSLSLILISPSRAVAADADAAQALFKKEGCTKCHAMDKKKEGTSLMDISKKYAGKPDAEAKILHQMTAGEKVKMDDGTEQDHKIIKTADKAEINNLIGWILSLKN